MAKPCRQSLLTTWTPQCKAKKGVDLRPNILQCTLRLDRMGYVREGRQVGRLVSLQLPSCSALGGAGSQLSPPPSRGPGTQLIHTVLAGEGLILLGEKNDWKFHFAKDSDEDPWRFGTRVTRRGIPSTPRTDALFSQMRKKRKQQPFACLLVCHNILTHPETVSIKGYKRTVAFTGRVVPVL